MPPRHSGRSSARRGKSSILQDQPVPNATEGDKGDSAAILGALHISDGQASTLSEEEAALHASLQDDEFLALEAIYLSEHVRTEKFQKDKGPTCDACVYFDLPISIGTPSDVEIVACSSTGETSAPASNIKLSNLPPISLQVRLPQSYPLKSAPQIVSITAPWISPMPPSRQAESRQWILRRLTEQWEEVQGECLWIWAEWLREGWVEEVLTGSEKTVFSASSASGPTTSRSRTRRKLVLHEERRRDAVAPTAKGNGASAHGLTGILSAYDRLASQSAFDKDRFLCGICLEAKRGDSCVRVEPCDHVFCRECMMEYLSLHLTEGSLHSAQSCPAPSCMARPAEAAAGAHQASSTSPTSTADGEATLAAPAMGFISDEQMIRIIHEGSDKELVDEGKAPPLVSRLEFLKAKVKAESDPTAVPCPRPDCQALTGARQEDIGTGSRWEAYRQCQQCGMSFCVWCRKTWHAPSPCSLPSTSSLIEKYDASDAQGKLVMERRYGRKNLLKLKAAYEEEKANQDWLKGKTQSCPNCPSKVEKSMGCNHMTCSHCMTHFCYLCGTRLNPAQPYVHFNTRATPCYNRLFDGILEQAPPGEDEGRPAGGDDELNEQQLQRRREEEQHLLALAAIQAAFGEDH